MPIVLSVFLWGCVNSIYDAPETTCTEDGLKANATFSEIKQLYKGEVIRIKKDLVVEGYVISSDKAGNFYGTLHLQDRPEHPEDGFQIDVDVRDYHLFYPVGKKILIRLKGLYLGKSGGAIKAGGVFTYGGSAPSVGRLPASQVNEHIFVSCDPPEEIVPEVATPEALNDTMVNTLVRLNGMEVAPEHICQPYAIAEESGTDRILRNCEDQEIILQNSGYADFQSRILPEGNGTVTGVLGKSDDNYQLTIRDTSDLKLADERCGGLVYSCDSTGANVTVAYIRKMYKGRTLDVPGNMKIRATVISDRSYKNIDAFSAVVQDSTAGIICEFTSTHQLNIGDKVELSLLNTVLEEKNGLLYVGNISPENVISSESGPRPEPEKILLSGDLAAYENELVRIEGVQFEIPGLTYSGTRILTDCRETLKLFTREKAVFAGETVSSKQGNITGIVFKNDDEYRLRIRNPNDVRFTEAYEDCLGGTNLMITEYVEGSGYNKYMEVYNAADVDIDLSGYMLVRDYNGDGDFERYVMELSGHIASGEIAVYANPRAEIFQGEIRDTHGNAIGYNGDDQVVLMKNGIIIDHIGIPGENWGADKTLRRKTDIARPSSAYDENEWEIYPQDDVSGLGIR
ncbi:DUF5689 domain-containing protein [Sinomicrobium kalidii]|uniref:DUF5689 domain-containing protein n=1 Tax=Sinomicrobium kalidii TaxID=2900738 RepID=UPI001E379F12|nr:DUF5689 domain-containing protein [Sinomicrobium kalidii]UGU14203.1 DUF5689 domain-containing protein [Sinomicrobium kalidii]